MEALRFVFMVAERQDAKSAVGRRSVNIIGRNTCARVVGESQYVNMADREQNAKIVVGFQFALMAESNLYVRSVKGPQYVSMDEFAPAAKFAKRRCLASQWT